MGKNETPRWLAILGWTTCALVAGAATWTLVFWGCVSTLQNMH